MRFGQNLQYLRSMRSGMTQEDLAERMGVSRQTISKWETGEALPEIDKAMAVCGLFSCTLDALFREDMGAGGKAYSDLRVEQAAAFSCACYTVISAEPERDAILHMEGWAGEAGIGEPRIIGWDFPQVSQEQINVYHLHGYTAACVLPEGFQGDMAGHEHLRQPAQAYAALTIRDPFKAPFDLIPKAYKTLMAYLQVNGLRQAGREAVIPCYEKQHERGGLTYMDVFIAVAG
ncbi:MAG: helix-turn-helix transcriptional regulator [Christensenellales bacterium]